jgi:hypothetical protein
VSDSTALRAEFLLDPTVTFLNHGSFGAVPRAVFERYQEWQLELERQPVLFLARRLEELLGESRAALGADADDQARVSAASEPSSTERMFPATFLSTSPLSTATTTAAIATSRAVPNDRLLRKRDALLTQR